MPEIPATPGDWGDLSVKTARLCMNPAGLEDTAELEGVVEGNVLFGLLSLLGRSDVSFDEIALMRNSGADRLEAIIEKRSENVEKAFLAGQMLLCILRLANYVPERASVANAQKILAHTLRAQGRAAGRSTIMEAWGFGKPVAHLTGALIMLTRWMDRNQRPVQQSAVQAAVTSLGFGDRPKVGITEEEIARTVEEMSVGSDRIASVMFGFADRLLYLAERAYAPGQKKRNRPVLERDTVWVPPGGFAFAQVRVGFEPPLSKLEAKLISKSK